MASFIVFLPSFNLFWVITPYFLFAFTHAHGLPKPELFSSVILPTTTVNLSCVVPQDPVHQCFFMVGTYTIPSPSCQLTLTGEQMKLWGHVNPPSELPVKCFYTVNRSGVNHPSDLSSPVSVLVLDHLQKPIVAVHHGRTNKLFDIVCEIPKQSWNVTGCQLYTGHGENLYQTAKIASGNCHFYVDENDLFRDLQSVGSGEVSCDYTVNTEPSSLSPRSDTYTIQGFLATVYPPLTKNTPLTSPEAGLSSQSTPVELKVATRVDAHTVTVSPGSTLHLTSEYTMDASGLRSQSTPVNLKAATRGDAHTVTVSQGTVLILAVTILCIGLTGMSAFCLIWTCRKHKHQSSKGTLGRTILQTVDTVVTYTMITSTPLTVAPDGDKREDIFSEQDDVNQYNTVTYILVQDHRSPVVTQQDMTYNLMQMH